MSIYEYNVKNMSGKTVSLGDYAGKVLLVINSATECGFTPQYDDLQRIYEKFAAKGLEILDFPCNQFGSQAPGTEDEIHEFCSTRFGITFPLFQKIEVNGKGAEPLFVYLKSQKGYAGIDESHPKASRLKELFRSMDPDFERNADIKWNFTKFLVDRSGNVVARFEPTDDMGHVEEKIAALL